MKILHINQSDISGGAAIAGYRLHQSLLAQGLDSKLLVGTVKTKDICSAPVPRRPHIEDQLFRFSYRLGLNYIHLISTFNIPSHPLYQSADILNFHNLHTGYFNYLAISKLTHTTPAVYTLHDMWSFTGHCIYSYDCDRWKIGCGRCPYPNTYPEIRRDNTHVEWKLKNWVYHHSNLTIVAPSQWLAELAQQSMLNHFPVHYIPNGIDLETYQPLDQYHCRSVLGIPPHKFVLLFVAQHLADVRKGGDLLLKALLQLPDSLKADVLLLTMGDGSQKIAEHLGIETINLGYISEDNAKATVYSAADLFLFPTRADNLPLVLQESMACGTPMVSFRIGGVPDLVRPGVTGYLALPEDARDFSNGIVQLLEDTDLRSCMRQNCRKIAFEEYSLEQQAQRYIELYRKVLQK
jgi:glycosyltransferase involved in cell wall biosynthesis